MQKVEIDLKELDKLKEHSKILNIISCELEDFCKDEETILEGLYRLLQDYYYIKSEYYSNLKLKTNN